MADDIRVSRTTEVRDGPPPPEAEPSLGILVKQLAQDSATLVRQEVALARAEMRENMRHAARDAAMMAVGGGFLLVGLLVLVAALVAFLGDVLGNEYWAGALIVGVLFVAVGGMLAMKYMNDLKNDDLKPDQTIQTLKEDKRWLQSEMQDAKRDLA